MKKKGRIVGMFLYNIHIWYHSFLSNEENIYHIWVLNLWFLGIL